MNQPPNIGQAQPPRLAVSDKTATGISYHVSRKAKHLSLRSLLTPNVDMNRHA
jgi:hypothetical protein